MEKILYWLFKDKSISTLNFVSDIGQISTFKG